ncbi:MAG: tagaturonate epimerase family protein, partial [Candidatus Promineifilaceae bacterium]
MTAMSFPQGAIYPESPVTVEGTTYALASLARTGEKRLLVQGDTAGFDGILQDGMLVCELTAANAAELRSRLNWLNPVPLGRRTSFGFGDRLGSATPGHIASLRAADPV